MTLIDDIDGLIALIEKSFESDWLMPAFSVDDKVARQQINQQIEKVQDLYNYVGMALHLLKDYSDEDASLLAALESETMGDGKPSKPFFEASQTWLTVKYWDYKQVSPPVTGLKKVLQFLSDSLSYSSSMPRFAEDLISARRCFDVTKGAISRLKSRLIWTVLYPDTFSKDAQKLKERLVVLGYQHVWNHFQGGIDNFRQGHLSDSANDFSNALSGLSKELAARYGYNEGQIGKQTMFLDLIGFIPGDVREVISTFFSLLAKFRKGTRPTLEEGRLLVDQCFTLFKFMTQRVDEFKPNPETLERAREQIKEHIKAQKVEDAKRVLGKPE